MNPEINEAEIIAYYDNCEIDYTIVWHLHSQMCMHYGYWDESTKNLRQALMRMNQKLADISRVKSSDKVLDAGCGVGGSSIFLAKNYGCRTHGITLSDKQVTKCSENASRHQADDLCSFYRMNYLETDFPDEYFDVVWAIESVCYAWDKRDFLLEAHRVLKPGGRLVVADFFSKPLKAGSEDYQLMDKWTNTWAIKSYATIQEFQEGMDACGFKNQECINVTENVLPSIRRLYYAFYPGFIATYLSELIGLRNRIQTRNTWSTYYQYKAYQRGLWLYNIFSATK